MRKQQKKQSQNHGNLNQVFQNKLLNMDYLLIFATNQTNLQEEIEK